MTYEVIDRAQYPYYNVTLLFVTFPNGERAIGTGALVDRNDILTATHVIYSPDDGGWASDIEIYFGADYNSNTGRLEHQGYYNLTSFSYRINAWPDQVNSERPYDLLSEAESQYDVALIGLSVPVGDTLGWFGLASGYNGPVWAHQVGYPAGTTGMMAGEALVSAGPRYGIYEAYRSDGSDILGPGSSGGPLYVYENGDPYIIGVKSAGSSTSSVWADIGFTYDWLIDAIQDNDDLIAGNPPPTPGPAPEPPPPAPTPPPTNPTYDNIYVADLTRGDFYTGGPGLDAVVYHSNSWNYDIQLFRGYIEVEARGTPYTYDLYTEIERVVFSDGVLAVDIGAGQNTGSAYRAYQAAFGRTPDEGGLRYWISILDNGIGLLDVAHAFTVSPEFQSRYGTNPDAETLVYGYYLNVLGRAPEASGFDYWVEAVNNGYSAAALLASFTESPENIARVAPALNDGIWLG